MIETLDALPLIAILRGLEPEDAVAIGEAIVTAGFLCLEVPLNSPRPLDSIQRLRRALEGRALVGAGTVLTTEAARDVADAGGQMIISPNTDADVIRAAKALGLLSIPGFFTPSEAFVALDAGADALKLFPAEIAGPQGLTAMRAVLPTRTRLYAVGGVGADTIHVWKAAGATGLGIGSSVFKPGRSALQVQRLATEIVKSWNQIGTISGPSHPGSPLSD